MNIGGADPLFDLEEAAGVERTGHVQRAGRSQRLDRIRLRQRRIRRRVAGGLQAVVDVAVQYVRPEVGEREEVVGEGRATVSGLLVVVHAGTHTKPQLAQQAGVEVAL